MPNVEIAALCDVDQSVVDSGCKTIEAAGKKRPATYADYPQAARRQEHRRRVDRDAQLPSHAADDLGGPGRQGRPRREAVLVQHVRGAADHRGGAQVQPHRAGRHRRQAWLHEAKQKTQGRDHRRRLHGARARASSGATRSAAPRRNRRRPASTTICGSVRRRCEPFTQNRFHYNWHWQWDYGNGDLGNQGAHQMHAARLVLGVRYPTKISSMGGHYCSTTTRRRPNTHVGDLRVRGRRQEEDAGLRSPALDHQQRGGHRRAIGCRQAGGGGAAQTVGNIWYGSKGYLATGAADGRRSWAREQAPGPKSEAGPASAASSTSSTSCAAASARTSSPRSRKARSRRCSIHLANISYRTGRTLYFDPVSYTCKGDAEATAMFTRAVPRAVHGAGRHGREDRLIQSGVRGPKRPHGRSRELRLRGRSLHRPSRHRARAQAARSASSRPVRRGNTRTGSRRRDRMRDPATSGVIFTRRA